LGSLYRVLRARLKEKMQCSRRQQSTVHHVGRQSCRSHDTSDSDNNTIIMTGPSSVTPVSLHASVREQLAAKQSSTGQYEQLRVTGPLKPAPVTVIEAVQAINRKQASLQLQPWAVARLLRSPMQALSRINPAAACCRSPSPALFVVGQWCIGARSGAQAASGAPAPKPARQSSRSSRS